jgi:hypothetical protein
MNDHDQCWVTLFACSCPGCDRKATVFMHRDPEQMPTTREFLIYGYVEQGISPAHDGWTYDGSRLWCSDCHGHRSDIDPWAAHGIKEE